MATAAPETDVQPPVKRSSSYEVLPPHKTDVQPPVKRSSSTYDLLPPDKTDVHPPVKRSRSTYDLLSFFEIYFKQPVKRSSSYDLLPPDMSELKVILLGSSWSERSSVGNFILGKTGFNKAPNGFERITGSLKNKTIAIINTPDLPSDISQHQLTEFIKDCVRLSDPGPHVFLLVLQPEDFTEEQRQSLCKVLETFSDRSFDHSLVLKLTPKKTSGLTDKNKETLKDMIRKCGYRHLKHKSLEHEELLTRLGQVAKENNGKHVSYEAFEIQQILNQMVI